MASVAILSFFFEKIEHKKSRGVHNDMTQLSLKKMRLVTHNMLRCNVKGVESGYPLRIEAVDVQNVAADFNEGNR